MDKLNKNIKQPLWKDTFSGNRIVFILLGMLKEKPDHGYNLKQRIQGRKMEQWARIKLSGIYPALNKLEQIRAIKGHRERDGKNPERIVYNLTDYGKKLLQEALHEFLQVPKIPPLPNHIIGMYFLNVGAKQQVLEDITRLKETVTTRRKVLINSFLSLKAQVPYYQLSTFEVGVEIMDVAIRKLGELIKKVEKDSDFK